MIRRRETGRVHKRPPKPFYNYYKMSDDDPIDISYASIEPIKTHNEYAAAQRDAINKYKHRLEQERMRRIEYEDAVDKQLGTRKFRYLTRGW